MLYDIYKLKKSIIEFEKDLRKLSVKRKRCNLNDTQITSFSFLFASMEYIKSINSFVISYELNLKNESLVNEIKIFLQNKRDNLTNVNIIDKITSSFIVKRVKENHSKEILSYLYLNDLMLPFKYTIKDFTILNIDSCQFLEGIEEIDVKGNLIIRFDKLLLELSQYNLLRISIHKRFLESFAILKFKSQIPKPFYSNYSKFYEGIDLFFKTNGFQFLLKKKRKLKQLKITKVYIKNNFIKIQFSEKMINKLLSLKNIFKL